MSADDMRIRARNREASEAAKNGNADEAVIELLSREVHSSFERVINRMAEATFVKNKDKPQLEICEQVCKIFNGPMKPYGMSCRTEMVNRQYRIIVSVGEERGAK
jgi:hypothetical protein